MVKYSRYLGFVFVATAGQLFIFREISGRKKSSSVATIAQVAMNANIVFTLIAYSDRRTLGRRPVFLADSASPNEAARSFHAFVIETRTSQKINNSSAKAGGTNQIDDPRQEAGNTFCWPRKNDAAAMNSAKHIRQRCRAILCVPKTPLFLSMRTSPTTDSRAIEPKKK